MFEICEGVLFVEISREYAKDRGQPPHEHLRYIFQLVILMKSF